MRRNEKQYVRWESIGFFDQVTRSTADDGARDVDVGGGWDVAIPIEEETLYRVILARHAQGEYTTRQVWRWLQSPAAFEGLAERLCEDGFDLDTALCAEQEPRVRVWLIERHEKDDVIPEWSESISDQVVWWAEAYMPDWLDFESGSGGGMCGGQTGSFTLPEGKVLSDVTEHMEAAIDRYLDELEPVIPEA